MKVPPEVSQYLSRLGRKGGRIGGTKTALQLTEDERADKARQAGLASAEVLTPEERRERARKAAEARWAKAKKKAKSKS